MATVDPCFPSIDTNDQCPPPDLKYQEIIWYNCRILPVITASSKNIQLVIIIPMEKGAYLRTMCQVAKPRIPDDTSRASGHQLQNPGSISSRDLSRADRQPFVAKPEEAPARIGTPSRHWEIGRMTLSGRRNLSKKTSLVNSPIHTMSNGTTCT